MKLVFLITWLSYALHSFTTQVLDEAAVRSLIMAVFFTLIYLAIRAIVRLLKP